MHAKDNADQPTEDLVLETLPSGQEAWLRPELPRYVLTDKGRRAVALAEAFGPWPTVAEAVHE